MHFLSTPVWRLGRLAALLMVFLGWSASSAVAATITVCPSGCNFDTIQGAIDRALEGDTVLVGDGTYHELIRVWLWSGVTIRSLNGPTNTIIDGDAVGTVVTLMDATLDGFTVRNGRGNVGGIAATDSVIRNCIVTGNSGGDGGIQTSGSTVANCIISDNSDDGQGSGGAWFIDSTVSDCTITRNTGSTGGVQADRSTLTNCTISDNLGSTRYSVGAVAGANLGDSTMENCTVTGNRSAYNGGGSWGGIHAINSEIRNSTISGNTGGNTAGIKVFRSTVSGCTISGNSGGGGAGGVDRATFENCTVSDNELSGIYVQAYSTISNSAIIRNQGSGVRVWSNSSILDSTVADNHGEGVDVWESSIERCVISRNTAGGVSARSSTIRDCVITENTYSGVAGDSFVVASSTISGNGQAGVSGSRSRISGCRITGNTGGGASISASQMEDCIVQGNSSLTNGGGITAGGSDGAHSTIRNCTVVGNSTAGDGGGINTNGDIFDSIISDNTATSGGGVYGGRTVANCTIVGNAAYGDGGGMHAYNDAVLLNCLIAGNFAEGRGGGISGAAVLHSSTISDNRAGLSGGGLFFYGDASATNAIVWRNLCREDHALDEVHPASLRGSFGSTYSNIRGGVSGAGNIAADPLFLGARSPEEAPTAAGDYHIAGESPCVDAGSALGAPATDIDGDTRPLDGGFDIGADEAGPCGNASDMTPNPFTLTDRSGVELDTIVTSNTITVSGLCSTVPLSVAGGAYSLNGGDFTDVAGTVRNGDRVTLRVVSSQRYLATTSMELVVGDVRESFSVETRDESCDDADPFAIVFINRVDIRRGEEITSNVIVVDGICMPAPIMISGGTYSINGGEYASTPGTVLAGDAVRVRVGSSASYSTTTSARLTIGGVSQTFSVTTVDEPCTDAIPDAFAFADVTDAALNAAITSDAVTVSGMCLPAPISISGGTYAINGGTYRSYPGMVSAGSTVRVRVQSSGNPLTTTGATLTIGGVSDTFSVTTLPAVARTARFTSVGAQDGWILESSEMSGRGGSQNSVTTTIRLGDDPQDRQALGIFSFNTAVLPDNAIISAATLAWRRQGVVGSDPFRTHGRLVGDVIRGAFGGSSALQVTDFQAAPGLRAGVTPFTASPGGRYSAPLADGARSFINKRGLTQIRLRFARDDDDDRSADAVLIYSGNAAADLRPTLEVIYTTP